MLIGIQSDIVKCICITKHFVLFLVALHIFFGLQVKAEQSALAALWKSKLLCGKVCVLLVAP